jgi:hypothetical protein
MSCLAVCGIHNQRMSHERNHGALILLLTGVAALACRKPDYFPLKDNQVWRYAASEYEVVPPDTAGAEARTYAIAVTGSAVQPGLGRVYEVRITRDEEPWLSFFFRKTRDAVFVLPASHLDGLEPTSGWVKLLELPLRKGAFWNGDAEHSVSFKVMDQDSVETRPAASATASASGSTRPPPTGWTSGSRPTPASSAGRATSPLSGSSRRNESAADVTRPFISAFRLSRDPRAGVPAQKLSSLHAKTIDNSRDIRILFAMDSATQHMRVTLTPLASLSISTIVRSVTCSPRLGLARAKS